MMKRTVLGLAAVFGLVSLLQAETYAEKVKNVDAEKKTITIVVEGKETTFLVDEKAEIKSQVKRGKQLTLVNVKDGLKGVKAGVEATVTTEKRSGEEVVTKIVLLVPEKK